MGYTPPPIPTKLTPPHVVCVYCGTPRASVLDECPTCGAHEVVSPRAAGKPQPPPRPHPNCIETLR